MADGLGFVSIPVLPTFSGIAKSLTDNFVKPAEMAGKKATKSLDQSAQDMVASLNRQATASARKLKELDQAYNDSMTKRQKIQGDIKVAQAEITAAEEKYQKALAKGASGAAELVKLERAKTKLVEKNIQLEKSERDVRHAEEKHAAQLKDLKDTTEKYQKAQADLANASEQSAGSFSKLKGGMSDIMGKASEMGGPLGSAADLLTSFKAGPTAGIVAVTGALGTAAAAAIDFNEDLRKSQIDMQNKMGLSADAARDMQAQVADALGSGMGDYEATADSVLAIQQTLADNMTAMAGQSAADLSDNFLAFSQTFGTGMSETVATVDNMINSGLVDNAQSGIDLLTAGFQQIPEALQGEALDAVNEYGKHFANMGMDGSQAMKMLVDASGQGSIAIDKVGDAVKEFSLKAVDPAVVETLSEYGVQVDDLAGRVARGGPEAAAAMAEMADQLLAIPDDGERAAAAIAAFGTPLEDLAPNQIPKFLEGLKSGKDGMSDFAGASQDMADNTSKSLSGMMNSLKGKMKGWAIDANLAVDEWAGNLASSFVQSNFVQIIVDSFTKAWDFVASGLGWAKDAILAGWDAATEPFTRAYDRIVAPISDAFTKAKDTVSAAWQEITASFNGGDWGYGALSSLIGADKAEWIVTKVGDIKGAWEEVKGALTGGDWGNGALADLIGADNAKWILDQIALVRGVFIDAWGWIKDKGEQLQPLIGKALDFLSGQFVSVFGTLTDTAKSLSSAFGSVLFSLLSSIGTVMSTLWDVTKKVWEALKPLAELLWNILWPVLKTLGAIIGGVVVGAVFAFMGALRMTAGILNVVADAISWLVDTLVGPLIEVLGQVVGFIIEKVVTVFSGLYDIVMTVATGIIQWLSTAALYIQENFWPAIQAVLGALGTALSAIWDALNWAWENILQPVFNGIWELIQVTLGAIATVVIAPLIIAWNLLSSAIQWTWESVVQPVWQAISDFATETLWPMLQSVFQWIGDKWNWLSDTFSTVWTWMADNIFTPMMSFFTDTLWPAIDSVVDWISDKWNWLSGVLFAAWEWVYTNVIQREIQGFQDIWTMVLDVANWIGDKWNWLSGVLQAGWNFIDSNVFTPLKAGLDTVKGWFQSAVDGIVGIWESLKTRLAAPMNWVIDKVYNNGIRAVWDKVANLIGMEDKKLPEVPVLAFATGGVLPGYTPGRDVHRFYSPTAGILDLSGGESIMRPEWTRAVGGPAAVAAMNAAARAGNLDAATTFIGTHGIPNPDGDEHASVANLRKAVARIHGRAFASGGVYTPTPDEIARMGGGKINESLWIAAKTAFPNATLNAAKTDHQVDGGYHPMGQAVDLGGPLAQIDEWIYDKFRQSAQLIYGPGKLLLNGKTGRMDPADQQGIANAYGAGTLAGHYDHVHWASDGVITSDGLMISMDGASDGTSGASVVRRIAEAAISSILDPISNAIPTFDGWVGEIPKGMFDKLKASISEFILGKAGQSDYTGASGITGNVESWREMAMAAMRRNGFDADNPAQVNAMLAQIQSESGGDPGIAQQIVDVNGTGDAAGVGLLQIIPGTFAANRDPDLPDDRRDPWANMNAALRYYKGRYGTDLTTMWGHGHGYALGGVLPSFLGLYDNGGWLPHGGMAFNASGKPEPVFNNEQWGEISNIGDLVRVLGDLVPALKGQTDVIAKQADNIQDFLVKAANYGSEEGITARNSARKILDIDMGFDLPGSDLIKQVLDGEDSLWSARSRQLGHLDELKEKEEALAEARKNLADLQADAEEKLKRIREDIDDNAEENAKKRAEEIEKANDAVSKAEENYAKARASQVQDLDHITLISQESIQGLIPAAEGLAGQLVSMGVDSGMVSAGLGQVVGALGSVAGMAGPAGISLGVVLEAAKIGFEIGKKIVEMINELIERIYQARLEAKKTYAEAWAVIVKEAEFVAEQQANIAELQQALIRGMNDQRDAQYALQLAVSDRLIAEAEGNLSVATARKALDEEIAKSATAASIRLMGLQEDWDSYLSYQAQVSQGVLTEWSNAAISELYAYEAARATALKNELSARVEQIKAESALAAATRMNLRNQQDLITAQERLIKMSAKVAGVDLVDATANQQVADLMVELAEVQKNIDSNTLGRWGYKLGASGSYANEYRGQLAQKASLETALKAVLEETGITVNQGKLKSTLSLMAKASFRDGDAMAVLRSQMPELAEAETALKIQEKLQPIYDAQDKQTDLERKMEDFAADIDLYEQVTPLEQTIKGLDYTIAGLQKASDAWADGNEDLRGAYFAAAKANEDAANKLGVNWHLDANYATKAVKDQIAKEVTIHLDGENMYTADQVDELLAQVTSGTNVNVTTIKTATTVATSRRKETV